MPAQHPHLLNTALYFPFSAAPFTKSPIPIPKSPNPNVVGFQNKDDMVLGSMNQLAPNFLQVGGEGENAKVTLADFKVDGYDHEMPIALDALRIVRINGNGITEIDEEGTGLECIYTWQDCPMGNVPAGWYGSDGGILVSAERLAELQKDYPDLEQSAFGDAATVEFPFGTGFRVVPADDGNPYVLTFSGEVRQKQSTFTDMTMGLFNLMGNCSPVEVKLSQLTVDGYDHEMPIALDALRIVRINGNGITEIDEEGTGLECIYTWQDCPMGNVPAGWYGPDGGILVSAERLAELQKDYPDLEQSAFGDAAGIKFPAGYGFRVAPADDGNNYTLTIPSPMGE